MRSVSFSKPAFVVAAGEVLKFLINTSLIVIEKLMYSKLKSVEFRSDKFFTQEIHTRAGLPWYEGGSTVAQNSSRFCPNLERFENLGILFTGLDLVSPGVPVLETVTVQLQRTGPIAQ